MKYAIVTPCDQTILYLVNKDEETISHLQAKLWDLKEEAEEVLREYNSCIEDIRFHAEIEEVTDIDEFRSRPDTW